VVALLLELPDDGEVASAETGRGFNDGIEDGLDIIWGAADDVQHLRCGRLKLEGLR
jgi:hypothetical protein